MRTDLLPIIACPICQRPLTLQPAAAISDTDTDADANTNAAAANANAAPLDNDANTAAEILSGALTCPPCGARYPIADGIPNLLPPELRNPPTT